MQIWGHNSSQFHSACQLRLEKNDSRMIWFLVKSWLILCTQLCMYGSSLPYGIGVKRRSTKIVTRKNSCCSLQKKEKPPWNSARRYCLFYIGFFYVVVSLFYVVKYVVLCSTLILGTRMNTDDAWAWDLRPFSLWSLPAPWIKAIVVQGKPTGWPDEWVNRKALPTQLLPKKKWTRNRSPIE